jgi:aarF domain-containing kinase
MECFGDWMQATQVRTRFVKDEAERERMWEERHEIAAEKIYSLCSELGGFFLKVHEYLTSIPVR